MISVKIPTFFKQNPAVLNLIIIYTALHCSHFAVMTIYVLYLSQHMEMSASETALTMFMLAISLRAMRIFLIPLGNYLSTRFSIVLGLFICCVAYLLNLLESSKSIYLFLIFLGIGYGLTAITIKTAIADEVDNSKGSHLMAYTYLSLGTNIAGITGPLLGAWWFSNNANSPFVFAAIICFASALLTVLTIRSTSHTNVLVKMNFSESLKGIFKIQFVKLFFFSCCCWLLYAQIFTVAPYYTGNYLMLPELVGSLVAANALIVILIEVPVNFRTQHLDLGIIVRIACVCIVIGALVMFLAPSIFSIFLCIVFWSVAETLLMPRIDSILATKFQKTERRAVFTFNSLAAGAGEGSGIALGILIISQMTHLYSKPEGYFGLMAFIAAFIIFVGYTTTFKHK